MSLDHLGGKNCITVTNGEKRDDNGEYRTVKVWFYLSEKAIYRWRDFLVALGWPESFVDGDKYPDDGPERTDWDAHIVGKEVGGIYVMEPDKDDPSKKWRRVQDRSWFSVAELPKRMLAAKSAPVPQTPRPAPTPPAPITGGDDGTAPTPTEPPESDNMPF
jgi:hypothetical protein